MNELQQELQEAAAELRRSVQDRLDPDAALASITAPPARHRRRVLAVAAAIAVLALGATAVIRSTDDDLRVIGEPPATVPAAPATTTVPPDPSTSLPPAATVPPATWVAEDDAGRLVVVDTASGQVLRSLGQFDAPEAFEASGDLLPPRVPRPDRDLPRWRHRLLRDLLRAGAGVTYADSHQGWCNGTGELRSVPCPESRRLTARTGEVQRLTVTKLATGEVKRYEASDPPTALWELTWSPDGRYLAWEQPNFDTTRRWRNGQCQRRAGVGPELGNLAR